MLLLSLTHKIFSLSLAIIHTHTPIGIMLISPLCSVTGELVEPRALLTGSVRLRAPAARFDRASPDSWD